jgi:hypothetical protein
MLDSPALLSNRESTAPLTSAEPDLGICPHGKRSKASSSSTIRNCCDSVRQSDQAPRRIVRDRHGAMGAAVPHACGTTSHFISDAMLCFQLLRSPFEGHR